MISFHAHLDSRQVFFFFFSKPLKLVPTDPAWLLIRIRDVLQFGVSHCMGQKMKEELVVVDLAASIVLNWLARKIIKYSYIIYLNRTCKITDIGIIFGMQKSHRCGNQICVSNALPFVSSVRQEMAPHGIAVHQFHGGTVVRPLPRCAKGLP